MPITSTHGSTTSVGERAFIPRNLTLRLMQRVHTTERRSGWHCAPGACGPSREGQRTNVAQHVSLGQAIVSHGESGSTPHQSTLLMSERWCWLWTPVDFQPFPSLAGCKRRSTSSALRVAHGIRDDGLGLVGVMQNDWSCRRLRPSPEDNTAQPDVSPRRFCYVR